MLVEKELSECFDPESDLSFCYWRQNSRTKSSRQQEDWGTKELMILVLSFSFLIFRSSNSTDLPVSSNFQTFTWLSSPVHRRLDGSIVTDNPTWYGVSFRRSQQDSEPQSSNCGWMWAHVASWSLPFTGSWDFTAFFLKAFSFCQLSARLNASFTALLVWPLSRLGYKIIIYFKDTGYSNQLHPSRW